MKKLNFLLSCLLVIGGFTRLMGQVKASTENEEHWYFIKSSSTLPYCSGKVVYNTSPLPGRILRWGDKTTDVNAMWKFIRTSDGKKYYICNKATGMYLKTTSTAKAGEVVCVKTMAEANAFDIRQQGTRNSYTITAFNQNPVHAQQAYGIMVTWNEYRYGTASSWSFDEVSDSLLQAADAKAQSYKNDYSLVWSDEFNDDKESLVKYWNYQQGFLRNNEDQWYQKDNASIKDGNLVIEARKEHFENPNYVPGSKKWQKSRKYVNYTSAGISSNNKFDFTYGRLEVRAKIPAQSGSWPAIWTLGYEEKPDFHWPSSGEVDLMEYYKEQILANVIWGNSSTNRWSAEWNSRIAPMSYWTGRDAQWKNEYHVWRMDWDEESIKLYLDDELITICNLDRTINRFGMADGTNPFRNHSQYILLNLAMGGNSGGRIDQASLPWKYYVDYVRVYQKKGQLHHILGKEIITSLPRPVNDKDNETALSYQLEKGKISVRLDDFSNHCRVELVAADGRCVQRVQITGKQCQLRTSSLPKGVYVLKVSDGKRNKTAKICLQ